jgi:hypothetical protein
VALICDVFNWATRSYRDRLLIYDRTAKRFVATPLYMKRYEHGMVFHSGGRFLAVPDRGEAIVFTTDKVLGHFGTPSTQWRWGEDGSAWLFSFKTPKILVWRKGACRLIPFPRVPARDVAARGITHTNRWSMLPGGTFVPGHLAVWGDGKYIAVSETVSSSSLRRRFLMEWIQRFPGTSTLNFRRVTLYRNGHRVGSHRLPLRSGSVMYQKGIFTAMATPRRRGSFIQFTSAPYLEHLAFTADGKHLSWLLQDNGKLNMTVFAVP